MQRQFLSWRSAPARPAIDVLTSPRAASLLLWRMHAFQHGVGLTFWGMFCCRLRAHRARAVCAGAAGPLLPAQAPPAARRGQIGQPPPGLTWWLAHAPADKLVHHMHDVVLTILCDWLRRANLVHPRALLPCSAACTFPSLWSSCSGTSPERELGWSSHTFQGRARRILRLRCESPSQ